MFVLQRRNPPGAWRFLSSIQLCDFTRDVRNQGGRAAAAARKNGGFCAEIQENQGGPEPDFYRSIPGCTSYDTAGLFITSRERSRHRAGSAIGSRQTQRLSCVSSHVSRPAWPRRRRGSAHPRARGARVRSRTPRGRGAVA
eukprot:7388528-Prymnesium_polylepis.1